MLEKQLKETSREVDTIPKKPKLNFRFHNPNTPEATADYIIKILIEVNQKKIDRILKENAINYAKIDNKEGKLL